MKTKHAVLKFIRKNKLINPAIIRNNGITKKVEIKKILNLCEQLFIDNRILKTGPHTFTTRKNNYAVRRMLKNAIKNGFRVRIYGYGLTSKKKYSDVIHPEKFHGKYITYKNTAKDGHKNRRTNTILSITRVK